MEFTSIDELRNKRYIDVELPGWDVTDNFKCRLQRVNLLDLASKGKIPNTLMSTVIELFKGKAPDVDDENTLKTINDLTELFCEVTMVQPTFKEVQEAIGLTDEQKAIIYNYGIKGVRVLEPFREKPKDTESSEHGADVQQDTKPTDENR